MWFLHLVPETDQSLSLAGPEWMSDQINHIQAKAIALARVPDPHYSKWSSPPHRTNQIVQAIAHDRASHLSFSTAI